MHEGGLLKWRSPLLFGSDLKTYRIAYQNGGFLVRVSVSMNKSYQMQCFAGLKLVSLISWIVVDMYLRSCYFMDE